MIILPIKKKWYDLIKTGEKKEEYREIKPYYKARFRVFDFNKNVAVTFRNGNAKNSPSITCICSLSIGKGKKEWGAPLDKNVYILNIEELMKK